MYIDQCPNFFVNVFKDSESELIHVSYLMDPVWTAFEETLEWTAAPGYGIREVLKFLCDKCGYQNTKMHNTCIFQADEKQCFRIQDRVQDNPTPSSYC